MYGAAADLASCLDDAHVRVEASEGGQQRGVNVEMAVAPAFDEAPGVQSQKPALQRSSTPASFERCVERGVEGFARESPCGR